MSSDGTRHHGSTEERLLALLDRQEIEDCLLRYCRGIDRHDADVVRSAYHADARDDHAARIGPGRELADWANAVHDEAFDGHQHYLTNVTIDLQGDVAHVESYYFLAGIKTGGPEHILGGGRYADRFERRDGRWAIADRIVTHEWFSDPDTYRTVADISVPPAQDRTDPVYRRPLRVTREDRLLFGGENSEPVPISQGRADRPAVPQPREVP